MITESYAKKVLNIDNLSVSFKTYQGTVHALQNVNIELYEGEILGILGESGSGKSTIAMSIMSLLADNASVSGSIYFMGEEYISEETMKRYSGKKGKKILDDKLRNIRWKDISMVFQGAMNSFNPVYTIGKQIKEVYKIHTTLSSGSNFIPAFITSWTYPLEPKPDQAPINITIKPDIKTITGI